MPIAGDEAMQPRQFAVAALGVAGAAIFDGAVGARQRPGHQELRVLGEKESRAKDGNGQERQPRRQTIAPKARCLGTLCLRRPIRSDP
ncbi:MAG TPA: hypothetical protein VF051_00035 [Hyphomicrobiaceae bacterium]